MIVHCPCCGAGIDADADAELALEAAITELDAIRAALPDDGTDGRSTLHSRVARLVAELARARDRSHDDD